MDASGRIRYWMEFSKLTAIKEGVPLVGKWKTGSRGGTTKHLMITDPDRVASDIFLPGDNEVKNPYKKCKTRPHCANGQCEFCGAGRCRAYAVTKGNVCHGSGYMNHQEGRRGGAGERGGERGGEKGGEEEERRGGGGGREEGGGDEDTCGVCVRGRDIS